MIRRDQSFSGKTDGNIPTSGMPSTMSPITVLRPVTVLPGGSTSTGNVNGSPVVYLLTSPSNMRLAAPQQTVGTPQSGSRVLVLQLPSKNVPNNAMTPQPQKTFVTAPGSNVLLKRTMLTPQSSTPNNVSQIYISRAEDSSCTPPVKKFAINGPGGPFIRPLSAPASALNSVNLQQLVTIPTSTPSVRIISTSAVKRGANLVRLEQARSAVRACVAESNSASMVLHNRSDIATTSTASVSHIIRKPEVDQGILHLINFDRKALSQQVPNSVRLKPWSKLSEAISSLIPYHVYDTTHPPNADLLEHNISFAVRCQRLLSRKNNLRRRISKILFDETASRTKLENVLCDQLFVESLKEPDSEILEDVKVEPDFVCSSHEKPIIDVFADSEESLDDNTFHTTIARADLGAEPPQTSISKVTPKLVIKFGGNGGIVSSESSLIRDTLQQKGRQQDDNASLLRSSFDSSLLPQTNVGSVTPKREDSPSKEVFFWNTTASPSFNSPEAGEASLSAPESSLSEAELAVQSIL